MIRFAVRYAAPHLVLLAVAAACGGKDSTAPLTSGPPPDSTVRAGLWVAAAGGAALLRLAPAQLVGSGRITAATTVTTPGAPFATFLGIAFDTGGTMWVASEDDSLLIALPRAALAASGAREPGVVISSDGRSLSSPTGVAFDAQHRLWVANFGNGTLVRFDPAQLASSGAPTPAVVISGVGHPAALAFDASGSLWVSDVRRNRLVAFAETQLATSGSPIPRIVLSAADHSLASPWGLAFDASGSLWVANIGSRTVVAFGPAQLAASGSPTPRVTLAGNAAGAPGTPLGLAFDADGGLWVASDEGELRKFDRAQLASSGTPTPASRLVPDGHGEFLSLAFWPRVEGLPLR